MSRTSLILFLGLVACGGPEVDRAEPAEPVAIAGADVARDPMEPASAEAALPQECRTEAEIDPPQVDTVPPPADVANPPADAERTPSGLASRRLIPGCGLDSPGPQNQVTVHYTGWTTDGAMFDSSVTRGRPATFPVNALIAGWTEGLQLMVVGEQRRFWIPSDLAYGANPRPGAPAGDLVFDVDLIAIE